MTDKDLERKVQFVIAWCEGNPNLQNGASYSTFGDFLYVQSQKGTEYGKEPKPVQRRAATSSSLPWILSKESYCWGLVGELK
ncbi:hypothetical protein JRQ81_004822 [Phrynocephalus forsythii]|uniref:Uncharacterized protein n=1 Tax=Phrynocephalus forsythii TaxID=171643 RepID=A0A9Q0XG05_9SAUR|nr:hypothetical protein JRQ81_004822 [Phrynocephalus forsythii]